MSNTNTRKNKRPRSKGPGEPSLARKRLKKHSSLFRGSEATEDQIVRGLLLSFDSKRNEARVISEAGRYLPLFFDLYYSQNNLPNPRLIAQKTTDKKEKDEVSEKQNPNCQNSEDSTDSEADSGEEDSNTQNETTAHDSSSKNISHNDTDHNKHGPSERGSEKYREISMVDTGTSGLLFIRLHHLEPLSFVQFLFEKMPEMKKKEKIEWKHTCRIVPMSKIFKADDLDQFRANIRSVIGSYFPPRTSSIETPEVPLSAPQSTESSSTSSAPSYAVLVRVRNNNRFQSTELRDCVVTMIGRSYPVNLSNPDKTVIVEVFKAAFGITVTDLFNKYKKFNVQQKFEVE